MRIRKARIAQRKLLTPRRLAHGVLLILKKPRQDDLLTRRLPHPPSNRQRARGSDILQATQCLSPRNYTNTDSSPICGLTACIWERLHSHISMEKSKRILARDISLRAPT